MKEMRKTRISIALAAALAGGAASTQVGAVELSQVDLGDAGIFPYYTVRGGWTTDFAVTNTSDSTVAIKVRFHEAYNSRDVLDFIVVMSPHDYFNAWVTEDPDLGPGVRFPQSDTTCVVAYYPDPWSDFGGEDRNGGGGFLPFSNAAYTGDFVDYSPDRGPNDPPDWEGTIDRAREGYFTIIEMGSAPPGTENDEGTVSWGAAHQADRAADGLDLPNDCNLVSEGFTLPGSGFDIDVSDTYREFERNVNALKFTYALTNIERGVSASANAVHLANFATDYSFLNPTATQVIADDQSTACSDAQDAADDAQDAADDLFDPLLQGVTDWNAGGNGATCSIGINLGNVDSNPAAVFDFSGNDPLCDLSAVYSGLQQQDTAWTLAQNDANDAADDAAQICQQTGIPPRNLIFAQAPFYYNEPNLASGDFYARQLWQGHFLDRTPPGVPQPFGGAPDVLPSCIPAPGVVPIECAYDQPLGLGPQTAIPFQYFGPNSAGAVTWLLQSADLINEWANNEDQGAHTDHVITFPTKHFWVDYGQGGWAEYNRVYLGLAFPFPITNISDFYPADVNEAFTGPFSRVWGQGTASFSSCDTVGYNMWSRDELGAYAPGTVTSPQGTLPLCYEVNVLQFNHQSLLSANELLVNDLSPADIFKSADTQHIRNGWLGLDFWYAQKDWYAAEFLDVATFGGLDWEAFLYPEPENFFVAQAYAPLIGLPGVGIMVKEKTFGGPRASYGNITEHSARKLPLTFLIGSGLPPQ